MWQIGEERQEVKKKITESVDNKQSEALREHVCFNRLEFSTSESFLSIVPNSIYPSFVFMFV